MEVVGEGNNKPIEVEENMEENDRFSALPDALLLEILARLPSTKNTIRTGTLSKRWKSLWTLVPSLIFRHYYDCGMLGCSDFVSFVNKILTQCRQLKLRKFVVQVQYNIELESQIKSWIHNAISCDVEELDLYLLSAHSAAEFLLDEYIYINSCFTDLKLVACIFKPSGAISWKRLKSLYISFGELDEDLIENMLRGSPLLETLALDHCYGFRRLDITSKSVKQLVFSGYMNPNNGSNEFADIIEINAPYISSLIVQEALWLLKLLLLNVSSLVEARLDYIHRRFGIFVATPEETEEELLKSLIESMRHVNELKIGNSRSKVFYRLVAKGFVFPSNVKFPPISYLDELDDWSNSDLFDNNSDEQGDWFDDALVDNNSDEQGDSDNDLVGS